MIKQRTIIAASLLCISSGLSFSALADDAANNGDTELEEIVVTAEQQSK